MTLGAESLDIDRRFDDIVQALNYPVGAADTGSVANNADDAASEGTSVPALRAAAATGGVVALVLLGLVLQTNWFQGLGDGWRVVIVATWLVALTPLMALVAALAVGRVSGRSGRR
jgi:hypothetical protein